MSKKSKLNPVDSYIEFCYEWASVCRETVYGKSTCQGKIANFNLDDGLGYRCVGRSSSVKIKTSIIESGTYKAYALLSAADRSEREGDLLKNEDFVRFLEEYSGKTLSSLCKSNESSIIRKAIEAYT